MTILERLYEKQDKDYAVFQARLTPGVPLENFIGVRVPDTRIIAKEIFKEGNYQDFLEGLPHKYYDENMLHGLIISEIKDFETCIREVDRFLPYVDNWAVCDIMSPKIFKKNLDKLLPKIKEWAASDKTYTCRFGLEMLMSFYLDGNFKPEYLEIPAAVRLEDYYAKMMQAWFFATALTKQWDASLPYISTHALPPWTHNKTIQKAKESYRITPEQKEILNVLKV